MSDKKTSPLIARELKDKTKVAWNESSHGKGYVCYAASDDYTRLAAEFDGVFVEQNHPAPGGNGKIVTLDHWRAVGILAAIKAGLDDPKIRSNLRAHIPSPESLKPKNPKLQAEILRTLSKRTGTIWAPNANQTACSCPPLPAAAVTNFTKRLNGSAGHLICGEPDAQGRRILTIPYDKAIEILQDLAKDSLMAEVRGEKTTAPSRARAR